MRAGCCCSTYFNPRPPRGGRRFSAVFRSSLSSFQSTPSARRATCSATCACGVVDISIHALREEGDIQPVDCKSHNDDFNPRPPRGGRLQAIMQGVYNHIISIHALREEGDFPTWLVFSCSSDFNPRPPRGGRPAGSFFDTIQTKFQSTPSARRATRPSLRIRQAACISIHALREEGDGRQETQQPAKFYFNPRPPRGGRQHQEGLLGPTEAFQSTPSARRATGFCFPCHRMPNISIHALREEGDHYLAPRFYKVILLQSTPSARRATAAR